MAKITIANISIENFGPFRERQTLDLGVSGGRPVILVKALNGSGKTTLLTALQIGLYGHKAINGMRRSEYEQMLLGLHRKDALGNPVVEIGVKVEIGGSRREMNRGRTAPFDVQMSPRAARLYARRLLEHANVVCDVEDAMVVARTRDNTPVVEINCADGGGFLIVDTDPVQATDCLDLDAAQGAPLAACRLPANIAAVAAARQSARN